MASLSSTGRIGNTGASSLLKSASGLANQLADYNDKVAAANWASSDKGDAAWSEYQSYLTDRSNKLNATGVLSDASKALTMSDSLRSASREYVSSSIAKQSIGILEGNSTPQDKYSALVGFYNTAVSTGDDQLAQNIRMQADNLSQTIQYQSDQAQKAQVALTKANAADAKSNADQLGAGYKNLAQGMQDALKTLTNEYKQEGQVGFNANLKQFADKYKSVIESLPGPDGKPIKLGGGAAPTIGDIVSGVAAASHSYYVSAAQATALENPAQAQSYQQSADNIVNGLTKFTTPAGEMNLDQIVNYTNNANNWSEKIDQNGNHTQVANALQSYTYDANGNVQQITTGHTEQTPIDKNTQNKIEGQLKTLGFDEVKRNSDGTFQVQLGSGSSKWLDPNAVGSTNNGYLQLAYTPNGFQFTNNNKIYTLTTDKKGLGGVFQNNAYGLPSHIAGQYGFNNSDNGLIGASGATGISKDIGLHTLFNSSNTHGAKTLAVQDLVKQGTSQSSAAYQVNLIKNSNPTATFSKIGGVSYNFAGDPIGKAQMMQRAGGGFNFTDASGKAISAATYAMQTGTSFRDLLGQLAAKGDAGSKKALGFVGNDFGYDPTKVKDAGTANLYNSLTWGDGKNITAKF